MPVSPYLKDKQKTIESKYHQVAKRFETQYELMHQKIISRFHRETSEIELIRSNIDYLITKSGLPIVNQIKSKRFIPILCKTSTKKIDNCYLDDIDWTRGRFSGQTIQIVIRQGEIIEKIFRTPRGNIISVKRSELGFWFR